MKEETFLPAVKEAHKILDEAITNDKKQGYILIGVECEICGTQETTAIAISQMSAKKNANAAFSLIRNKNGRMLIADMLNALSTALEHINKEGTDD